MLARRKSFRSLLLAFSIAGAFCPWAIADEAIDANPKPPESKPGEETVFPKPCVEVSPDKAKAEPAYNKDSKVVAPETIPVSKVPDQVGIIETTRGWMADIERWKEKPK